MKVVVYANSGGGYGEGHAERCFQLLNKLEYTEAIWLCQNISERIREKLPDTVQIEFCSADTCAVEHHAIGARFLILDDYYLEYKKRSEALSGTIILAFDDLANRIVDCDILVDGNPLRSVSDYSGCVPASCQILTGSEYTLFPDDFSTEAAEKQKDLVHIFLGSTDPEGMTWPLLKFLLGKFPDYRYLVVCTRMTPYLENINQLNRQYSQLQVLFEPESLAEGLFKSEFAIGAPGTTTWQRMLAGCNSALLATAANQIAILEELDARTMIKYLGRWDNFSSIELAIERFFVQNERTDTPQFDTAGVGRIIQVMETVSMREPV